MTLKVIFAFDQDAGGTTNFFTLDDSVKGVLDNTTYGLGGDFSLVDVTEYVRSVNVSRGRSRILDRTQSGSAQIVLDNRTRLFDPTAGTAISPYAESIVPRKNVQVTFNDEPIFTGFVDDWNIEFDVSGDSTTTAICADGFVQLGQVTIGTATQAVQTSGGRVGTILNAADWPSSKRAIDTGVVTLQADTPAANTNALAYIQTITDTEFGAFFMDRAGVATFLDRTSVQDFTVTTTLGGTGIPISSISIDYGSEQLYNQVELSRVNGGTAIVSDATSQTTYGINELAKTGLLFDDDTELGDLAAYLLSRYKDPIFRINEVSVLMNGLTTAQQTIISELDITSPLVVTLTPTVGSAITQYATVDRIAHSLTPGQHTVTLSMSQAQAAFILDSSAFGVLDTDTLGF
jgi:hypothetical protein